MVTHLETDILECEVKWTLGSISTNIASRGDVIAAELLKILKDDAVKVLHSLFQKISGHMTEKVSFHSNPQRVQ